MAQQYVMGVDGGKSKTVCLVADGAGKIIGWGRGKSSDKYDVPLETALDEVARAAHAALDMAVLKPQDIAAACFGLAGDDWPEDNRELSEGIRGRNLARAVMVKNDAQIALRANVADGFGVVLCAGTHLATGIRTPDKQEWHSAWFSVKGMGGAGTGERIFWAVINAYDGRGPATALSEMLFEQVGVKNAPDLLREMSAGRIGEAELATYPPLVFRAHNLYGDAVAGQIIVEIGQDMARWVTGLMRRYDLLMADFPVILTGGIFKSEGSLLLEALATDVHRQAPHARLVHARYETVVGALTYAYEMSGREVSDALLETLQGNLPDSRLFRTDEMTP